VDRAIARYAGRWCIGQRFGCHSGFDVQYAIDWLRVEDRQIGGIDHNCNTRVRTCGWQCQRRPPAPVVVGNDGIERRFDGKVLAQRISERSLGAACDQFDMRRFLKDVGWHDQAGAMTVGVRLTIGGNDGLFLRREGHGQRRQLFLIRRWGRDGSNGAAPRTEDHRGCASSDQQKHCHDAEDDADV